MAKFCGNCGAKLDDDALVCGYCGEKLELEFETKQVSVKPNIQFSSEKKTKIKKFFKIAIVAIAVIVIATIGINIGTNFIGYKGTVRKAMKYYEALDSSSLVDMSSCVYECLENENYAEKYFKNIIDDDFDYYEDHVDGNCKISYEIINSNKLSDRKLNDFNEKCETSFSTYDPDAVSQIMNVSIKITAKGGKKSISKSRTIQLTKESDGWKLLNFDTNGKFYE